MSETETERWRICKGGQSVEEIIAKIEREKEFQRKKAEEYSSGIFQNEVIFARYDQAAKILEWVLGLLRE